MSSVLKISDAATLALHTAVLLADRTEGPLTTKEIALTFGISEAHLAKVLQRLAKAGIVHSGRGPKGGFLLGKRRHNSACHDGSRADFLLCMPHT